MGYQNRQPPEGINAVETGWQRDFWLLVVGFFASLLLFLWLLMQLAVWAARWTPFSWEQSLAAPWITVQDDPRQHYLQELAEQLAQAGGLDPALSVTAHYRPDRAINAFATLGGHVFIQQGVLDKVTSEQGLAFVLAHEIAHIQERHPARAAARELSFQLLLTLVLGRSDLGHLVGVGGQLAMLDYSREQEYAADAWALHAVYNHYGHVQGADELFRHLQPQHGIPEWMVSHPETARRLIRLEAIAETHQMSREGELLPLPDWQPSLIQEK